MPELFINPLALTELRHGNKGCAKWGTGGVARGERSYELEGNVRKMEKRDDRERKREKEGGKRVRGFCS